MKISEFVEQVICAGRRDHQSRKTWQCYAGWTRRYGQWLQGVPHLHEAAAEDKVSGYLAPFVQPLPEPAGSRSHAVA